MYRIGELAKMAEVTPDTIRYYAPKVGFACIPKAISSD